MIDIILDKGTAGRRAPLLRAEPRFSGLAPDIPDHLRRETVPLPDVPEIEVVRHYTALSRRNFGVDSGMYPLGSCTMKYNPRINETLATLDGFARVHPLQFLQASGNCDGIVHLLVETRAMLAEVTGMDAVTLQPAAGAHGEFTGLLVIRRYLHATGQATRNKIIVPNTAHGTNPASAAACNFEIVQVTSNEHGLVDLEQLQAALAPGDVAGIMLTNPNTLGLFEEEILRITAMVHDAGGLCYYDGANLNGICGICRPGDMGFDVVHVNLHKTFATPHGGGGPGAGPVGVKRFLEPFLPGTTIDPREGTTGNVKAFHGNVGVIIKAYCYMKALGLRGLRESTRMAVLNANYLKRRLAGIVNVPHQRRCYHEFVGNDEGFPNHVTTADIAKRMLDLGIHAPTIYFPLVVPGAIMIEPTETESIHRLDELVDAFARIKAEATSTPDVVKDAPNTLPVKRLDQVLAARVPVLTTGALKRMQEKE